jgi:hypothetical protein
MPTPGGGRAVARLRARAQLPGLPAGRGAYESFFLKLAAPGGGRAVWIRYTTLRRADGLLTGGLWITVFGPDGPVALRRRFTSDDVRYPIGAYVQVADAVLFADRAIGRMSVNGIVASWDITFDDGLAAFRHLRPDGLYRAPLPRTKLETLHPASTFGGTVDVDGTKLDVAQWRGTVGHNWGAEHAERWVWLQGNDIGVDGCHLDIGAGQLLLSGRLTPWVANGLLVLDGARLRLGGLGRVRGSSVDPTGHACSFRLTGRDVEVSGLLRRRPSDSVRWEYDGPSGDPHHVVNSSVADLSLIVRRHRTTRHLALLAGAVYESGSRVSAPDVPAGLTE